METIIIEDEKVAIRDLTSLLTEVCPQIEMVTELDSIAGTIEWFASHPMPKLVFMDIRLADGSTFEIFEHIHITCPIIFTTACNEYALRAFKVNNIGCLLKPIGRKDVEQALEKLSLFSSSASRPASLKTDELLKLMRSLKKQESYKTRFLILVKEDKLLPVSVDMIVLFYVKDCQVKVVLTDSAERSFPQTLDELTECLDPAFFFRANRQYLLLQEAIKDVNLWFNSRLSINLRHPVVGEKILVNKARVAEFKEWFCVKQLGNKKQILIQACRILLQAVSL